MVGSRWTVQTSLVGKKSFLRVREADTLLQIVYVVRSQESVSDLMSNLVIRNSMDVALSVVWIA